MSQAQHQQYRSQVARCLFLSQDRADITFVLNELCQKMSSPNQQSLAKLKRLARYLKRERQWGQVFEYGNMAEELTVFTDSDWAGCEETRKSSSAGVLMLEGHTMKANTRKQKVIAKSSAEAELYTAALGASEAKDVESMMSDLGVAVKPVLNIAAKATEHILDRQGIGKLKHQRCGVLVGSQRLRAHRIRSEENVAVLGTKPLSKAVIAERCLALGYVNMDAGNV